MMRRERLFWLGTLAFSVVGCESVLFTKGMGWGLRWLPGLPPRGAAEPVRRPKPGFPAQTCAGPGASPPVPAVVMVVASLVDPRHRVHDRCCLGDVCVKTVFPHHTRCFPDSSMSPAMFLEPPDKAACHHPGALGCKQKYLCYMGPDRCLDEAPAPASRHPLPVLSLQPSSRMTLRHQRVRAHDGHPTVLGQRVSCWRWSKSSFSCQEPLPGSMLPVTSQWNSSTVALHQATETYK